MGIDFLNHEHPPGVRGFYAPVGDCGVEGCGHPAQPRISCAECRRALCSDHATMVYPRVSGQQRIHCPEHAEGEHDGH
jgi:hypothetical protein